MALDRGRVEDLDLAVIVRVTVQDRLFGRDFRLRLRRKRCLGSIADDVGIGGIITIMVEIDAAEDRRVVIDVDQISLGRILIKSAVKRSVAVLIIGQARGVRDRRDVEHLAGGAVFVGIVDVIRKIDMGMTAQPDNILMTFDQILEAQVVLEPFIGIERTAVSGIGAVISRAVAHDRRVLDQKDPMPVAGVSLD